MTSHQPPRAGTAVEAGSTSWPEVLLIELENQARRCVLPSSNTEAMLGRGAIGYLTPTGESYIFAAGKPCRPRLDVAPNVVHDI
jgi:hypothetical protein